jgi:hypothetical protein
VLGCQLRRTVRRSFRPVKESMDEQDFEGTLVLEKLALIGKVNDFFEAIDSDDFQKAASLMKKADVDSETITIVLKKMRDADTVHE